MHDLLVIFFAIAFLWGVERLVRWWLRLDDEVRFAEAHRVLEQHGMEAFYYMPGVDIENPEFRGALDLMEHAGKIVLDRNGHVVGRLMPKVDKGPRLRLVVDNTQQSVVE